MQLKQRYSQVPNTQAHQQRIWWCCLHAAKPRPAHSSYDRRMDPQTATALLTGGFTIAGGVTVAVLSALLGRSSEFRKVKVEDDRRWLLDRRTVYAKYVGLAEVMLREIDGVAAFLSYDGVNEITSEDEEFISEGLTDYFAKWDESLQPLLGEVQLLATGNVADLADRVSGALMEITWRMEKRAPFTSYYPAWLQAQDLLHVLRDAMRTELGLPALGSLTAGPRGDDWPWLDSRPPYESYIQQHSRHRTNG